MTAATTEYAILVESAKQQRSHVVLAKSLEGFAADSAMPTHVSRNLVARELDKINQHITVDSAIFSDAAQDYQKLGEALVTNLHWPNDAISVVPQGSTSTQTLIRNPDASKFDIDAVCSVDISRVEAKDPMEFFNRIGDALVDWEAESMNRCWRVNFIGWPYYIDLTPSVPLGKIPKEALAHIRFKPGRYSDTALAVVDTPTGKWKTSNPQGFSTWIDDQSKRKILHLALLEKASRESWAADSVEPVPEQSVPLSDTLRIAIRLFKRHRDMAVQRGYIRADEKPISVVIVTLLTQCYEGLADLNESYTDPIELLADLAELMPGMVVERADGFYISNPTVQGENFAEKWNNKPALKKAFDGWCKLLSEDLGSILEASDEKSLTARLLEVFGCTGASAPKPPTGGGLAPSKPTRVHTAPAGTGLA